MSRRFFLPGDNGVTREFIVDGKQIHRRDHQASANAIMERNNELRKNPGAVKTTSFGKLELDIPISHMPMLDKFYPGIADPAHPDHKWQLRAFMGSPASAPYRLQDRKRPL